MTVRDRDLRIAEFTQTNEKTPQNQKFDPETYDFGSTPEPITVATEGQKG